MNFEGCIQRNGYFTKRDSNPTKQNPYLNGRIALNIVVQSDFDFGKVKPREKITKIVFFDYFLPKSHNILYINSHEIARRGSSLS